MKAGIEYSPREIKKNWSFDKNLIDEYFPFETFREGQREAIEFVLDAFESGKRYVILEGPVGSGKSPIGLAIARFFKSAYYLVPQKFLQSQIVRDFGDSGRIVDLKGRGTYPCNYYERHGQRLIKMGALKQKKYDEIMQCGIMCDIGYCRKEQQEFKSPQCFPDWGTTKGWGKLNQLPAGMQYSACPYYEQVERAMRSHTCLMNFSSFLFQTSMVQRFGPRELLIADEAHHSESQLLNFITVSMSDIRLRKYGWELEEFQTPEEYWIFFAETKVESKIAQIVRDLEEEGDVRNADEHVSILRRLRTFMKAIEEKEEWVCEFTKHEKYNTVKLKPVFAKNKAHQYLLNFGDKILLMSATILDVDIFCRSIGINRNDTAALRMKNRFPVKNRPIYINSAGDLTGGKAKMGKWGPPLLAKVDEVIAKYPGKRGIIHTHNFAIAQLIIQGSKFKSRLLFQGDYKDKEEMLKEHASRTDSIIIAPAMHEGLDLREELGRFAICVKIPFPIFFGDKQIERRIELDPAWYTWITALKLIQSIGRTVRSETDYADTWILDGGFDKFMNRAKRMIPPWFTEAIVQ